jgi:hypothetical protein
MKNLLLKLIEQIIYKMSENTLPNVKYSKQNYKVAKAALAVSELRKFLNQKPG